MKKIYQKPEIFLTKVQLESMIALSLTGEKANDSNSLGRERGSRNDNDNFEDLW